MAKDIKINWDSSLMQGDFDFDILAQDLDTDEGLQTAAIISLFTDRQALEDDILPDPESDDRRGWWGDLVSEIEDDKIGSRLWLLSREKTLEEVVTLAIEYAEEALQWFLDDQVAAAVDVTAERQGIVGNDRLAFLAKIYKTDGTFVSIPFEANWVAQANE